VRILVVEDELTLRQQLVNRLTTVGYAVDDCGEGEEALYLAAEIPYDLAIFDVGLPGLSGIDLIQELRKKKVIFPILILTARAKWQEKVDGLEAGADDYLTKPFHMEELLARVRALLRRAAGLSSTTLEFGALSIDTSSQTVNVQQQPVELTAFEYKVLEYLVMHPGKVISKSELTEHIYAQDFDRDSNVIEVFIRRLRKKLDPDNHIKPIETLRGRGYRFTLEMQ